MTSLLVAKFNQIASAIDTTNAQILALQAKLSELQEHQQQLLSVEQACQSAIAQIGTALSMLNHVDPSEIGTFKAAVEAQFGTDAIADRESATPTPAEPIEPPPVAPITPEPSATPEVEPAIDVRVTPEPEPAAPIEPESAPAEDIEQVLNKMPLPTLRMLAKSKGTDARGTKANLAARLKKLVTESDPRAAS
jgi:outer membrane murein-binding lipoprotein Lpp